MSIAFKWEKNEIFNFLSSCERNGLLPFLVRYIKKEDNILESGCGLARWVKKLNNLGYNCCGLEYSEITVKNVKEVWPILDIFIGDVLHHPFKDNSFDAAISLGGVEHFEEDLVQCPESYSDVGHPIKIDHHLIEQTLDRNYKKLFEKIFQRQEGRNPKAHYGTYLGIFQKNCKKL